mmetsp:Transcript_87427/g.244695  ORF Transcript_87427/g.244695 Transcript_87427/m.244695 type:complete len:369 (+) Transcript_87427:98-1204(+)
MGATLSSSLIAKVEPPTVLWVHQKRGDQHGVDLELLAADLALGGVQLLAFADNDRAVRAADRLGVSLRCVIQSCWRSSSTSLIEKLQDLGGRRRRHVPVLVLGISGADGSAARREVAALGETSFADDLSTPAGYVSLIEWIVRRCFGIEKVVTFVRHAQAEHNVNNEYGIRDPSITELGKRQAQELALRLKGLSTDVIITSPLRRTLQTTQLVFGGSRAPILVQSLLQEGGDSPCDVGSDKATLKSWFPGSPFNFDSLADDWYIKEGINHTDRLPERIARFVGWLRARPERSVVVVAHGVLLNGLLGLEERHESGRTMSWEHRGAFDNCEARRHWLLATGDWFPVPERSLESDSESEDNRRRSDIVFC